MTWKLVAWAAGAWLGIAVLAIFNGTLRQGVLAPRIGDGPAQVVSVTILLGIVIGIEAWLLSHPFSGVPLATLWVIGASWMAGTIAFEFLLGRAVLGMPWPELLAQYNVLRGQLWPTIPLAMLAGMPLLRRWLER